VQERKISFTMTQACHSGYCFNNRDPEDGVAGFEPCLINYTVWSNFSSPIHESECSLLW